MVSSEGVNLEIVFRRRPISALRSLFSSVIIYLHKGFDFFPVNAVVDAIVYIKPQPLCLDAVACNLYPTVSDLLSADAFFYFIVTGNANNSLEVFPFGKSFGETYTRGNVELITSLFCRMADFSASA